jgi:peptide deformylase
MSLTLPAPELTAVQHTRDPAARLSNVLYLPARAITAEEFRTPELSHLIEAMRALMHHTGGIGIAANQVGKRLQIFMIEAKPNNPRYQGLGEVPYQLFINPRIVAASAERRNFWHGCLSAVGEKRGNVATYEWIEVEAADEAGLVRRSRLEGLAAVIFQHELRHLLGGTYLDKATTLLTKEELDQKLDAKELNFFERADARLPLLIDDYRVGETLEEFYARVKI